VSAKLTARLSVRARTRAAAAVRSRSGAPEEAEQRVAQRLRVEVLHDVAREAEADRAALLAHHDDHGVRLLGDPERRAVPRAEAVIEDLGVRHREEHAGARDLQVADEHGAVVQLVHRLRHEQADEQLARHDAVEHDALALRELEHVGVLLEGDDRAHAVAGQLGRGGHDLVDHARLRSRADEKNARRPCG
jgi:hypothetical protein